MMSWFILFIGIAILIALVLRLWRVEYFLPALMWFAVVALSALLVHYLMNIVAGRYTTIEYFSEFWRTLTNFTDTEAYHAVKGFFKAFTKLFS